MVNGEGCGGHIGYPQGIAVMQKKEGPPVPNLSKDITRSTRLWASNGVDSVNGTTPIRVMVVVNAGHESETKANSPKKTQPG